MKTVSKITARYAETDQMGIVHHSVYPVWFEVARTEFIRHVGMSYTEMEQAGVMLPLAGLTCRYYYPARYEDEVTVTVSIQTFTPARIEFLYEVHHAETGKLLVRGTTLHGWTDHSLRPVNLKKRFPEIYEVVKRAQEEEAE